MSTNTIDDLAREATDGDWSEIFDHGDITEGLADVASPP